MNALKKNKLEGKDWWRKYIAWVQKVMRRFEMKKQCKPLCKMETDNRKWEK